jgi:hypothetical protein
MNLISNSNQTKNNRHPIRFNTFALQNEQLCQQQKKITKE